MADGQNALDPQLSSLGDYTHTQSLVGFNRGHCYSLRSQHLQLLWIDGSSCAVTTICLEARCRCSCRSALDGDSFGRSSLDSRRSLARSCSASSISGWSSNLAHIIILPRTSDWAVTWCSAVSAGWKTKSGTAASSYSGTEVLQWHHTDLEPMRPRPTQFAAKSHPSFRTLPAPNPPLCTKADDD